MRSLIPIFMSLLSIVTSRSEPIDFGNFGISDSISRNHWNEIFSKPDGIKVVSNENPRLKEFIGQHHNKDAKSGKKDPRDWNKPVTRYDSDPLNLRKIIAPDNIYDNAFDDFDETTDSNDELIGGDFNHMSNFLTKLLQQPSWEAPLVVVSDSAFSPESEESVFDSSDEAEIRPNVLKRSRYYRPYPYKRQNSRFQNGYDYETTHFCMPTRDDIFQLLEALHDIRQGNKTRNVHFCNRRRTARKLLTHIRFLGRRK